MAKFLTSNDLNAAVEKIFEEAYSRLILISPYIKLHDRYLSVLKAKKGMDDFKIIVVFGKNEGDISRSMKFDDFNFFKEFPNIEIRYEKRLHAKYYSNDSNAIITSMNLYSYSQDNNIESGVLMKLSLIGSDLDIAAENYFDRVIEQSDLLFQKIPEYESTMMGLSKKYKSSKIEIDKLSDFFANQSKSDSNSRKLNNVKSNEPQVKPLTLQQKVNNTKSGYCIRTGKEIQFNPKHPMADSAYDSWLKFKNENYPEKYCHFSGEVSNGETTFSKPILKKNWSKAKETFNL